MAMRYSDVTRDPKRGRYQQKSWFSSQNKAAKRSFGFKLRKINDWEMISPIKDFGVVKS